MKIKSIIPVLASGGLLVSCSSPPPPPPAPIVEEHNVTVYTPRTPSKPKPKPVPKAEDFRAVTTPG
ncbi:hypothetical protein N9A94_01425 [Akkermansiaceae bacterium]|nr:hypothetical protein [Akkermansiaceae bacterium]MDB4537830.1 hypothetical protein [Akkermansiaceae bacterium]